MLTNEDPFAGAGGAPQALIALSDHTLGDVVERMLRFQRFRRIETVDTMAAAEQVVVDRLDDLTLIVVETRYRDGELFTLLERLAAVGYRRAMVLLGEDKEPVNYAAVDLAERHGISVIAALRPPYSMRDVMSAFAEYRRNPRAQAGRTVEDRAPAGEIRIDDIVAVYQPKIRLPSFELCGFEALARWRRPDGTLATPDQFLSALNEQQGLDGLTRRMLRSGVAMLNRARNYCPRARVSVNLSGSILEKESAVVELRQVTQEAGLSPQDVILEFPETEVFRDEWRVLANIDRMALAGFGISLDDFGVGFSSLSRLKSMPITELKLDRRFVSGAANRGILQTILNSSAVLARELGINLVAEGIGSREDLEVVREIGVPVVQGFYLGRPMPADRFIHWIRKDLVKLRSVA